MHALSLDMMYMSFVYYTKVVLRKIGTCNRSSILSRLYFSDRTLEIAPSAYNVPNNGENNNNSEYKDAPVCVLRGGWCVVRPK